MKLTNQMLRKYVYQIVRGTMNRGGKKVFVLRSYYKKDGTFDYDQYHQTQVEGNKRKLDNVWVIERNIEFLSSYIKQYIKEPEFGICHGTRKGKEQQWFREYLDCNVIGTEISDTANQFPDTIQWDFHETKPEWIESVDFIYSNSLDHSYDPEKCLNAWISCLRTGGLCILEHSSRHGIVGVSDLDPFGADISVMPYLITIWGKGSYGVRELIEAPIKRKGIEYLHFIIVQKFRNI